MSITLQANDSLAAWACDMPRQANVVWSGCSCTHNSCDFCQVHPLYQTDHARLNRSSCSPQSCLVWNKIKHEPVKSHTVANLHVSHGRASTAGWLHHSVMALPTRCLANSLASAQSCTAASSLGMLSADRITSCEALEQAVVPDMLAPLRA